MLAVDRPARSCAADIRLRRSVRAAWLRRRAKVSRSAANLYRVSMAPEAEALLRQALALSDEARADIAALLLASLDAPTADDAEMVRSLWLTELDRRAKRVMSGEAAGEDWATVRERLANELAG